MSLRSNDMVEDLARHMHRQHAKTEFGRGEDWGSISPELRSYWRHMARSTLEKLGVRRWPMLQLLRRGPTPLQG